MKRFIDLADLEPAAVRDLIALAQKLEKHPEPQALAGKVLGLLFMNPSLRTLASFQSGMSPLTARCHTGMSSGRPNTSIMW